MGRYLSSGLLSVIALAACGTPFGPCYQESVLVGLIGTLDGVGLSSAGEVGPGNIASFSEVKAFAIDGQSLPGQRVSWTIEGLNGAGYLAVELPGTIAPAQTWTITAAYVGGGWGVSPGGGSEAAVSARFGASQAVAASGTITVLAIKPLRVRLDLTLTDGQTVSRRVQGEAAFSYRREEVGCT